MTRLALAARVADARILRRRDSPRAYELCRRAVERYARLYRAAGGAERVVTEAEVLKGLGQ